MRTEDLNLLVESVIEMSKLPIQEKRLSVKIDNPSITTRVFCDSGTIRQVVSNLLSNAIKYTPEGGKIMISFKETELKTGNSPQPSIQVTIADQGVGIPDGELGTIFDQFAQSSKTKTGAGGTGLGLAICHEIVKAHRGKIWAENNLEAGATFNFVLPLSKYV